MSTGLSHEPICSPLWKLLVFKELFDLKALPYPVDFYSTIWIGVEIVVLTDENES